MEVRRGLLGRVRLREALRLAATRHPFARAGSCPPGPWIARGASSSAKAYECDPVEELDCASEYDVDAVRTASSAGGFPSESRLCSGLCSPTFRTADRQAAPRRGRRNRDGPLPAVGAASLPATTTCRPLSAWRRPGSRRVPVHTGRRRAAPANRTAAALPAGSPPGRSGQDRSDGAGRAWEDPGCVNLRLSSGEQGEVHRRQRQCTTLNDVLLAALHLTSQRWNEAQGQPAGRVGTTMPLNVWPKAPRDDVLGN